MRILVTGKSGQLGRALLQELADHTEVVPTDRKELDISDQTAVLNRVSDIQPDVIINAAAYTAVDQAETDTGKCDEVNLLGPFYLAQSAGEIGARLIHFSTDYVFDGQSTDAYLEESAPNPLSAYGRSKLAGDKAVLASETPSLILRTGWLYSKFGPNFVQTITNNIRAKEKLSVVNDQRGIPTSAEFLSRVVKALLPMFMSNADAPTGLLNVACTGSATWYDFALECRRLAANQNPSLERTEIRPISSTEFAAAAQRPAYSCLSTARLQEKYEIAPPDWREELDRVFSAGSL